MSAINIIIPSASHKVDADAEAEEPDHELEEV